MEFPLICNGDKKNLSVSHNLRTKLTVLKFDGKYIQRMNGMKLTNSKLWPIILIVHEMQNLKIQADYDQTKDIFLVQINGQSYYKLPYRAPQFDPEKYANKLLTTKIWVNS